MPYGPIAAYRSGNRLLIVIDLPERGEPACSGRSENLVDPRAWTDLEDDGDRLGIKMTVCRPYGRRSAWPRRLQRLA